MSSSYTVCILIFLVAPGTNMQKKCFDFVFLVFFLSFYFIFFLYLSSICYLHGTGRFASMDPSCFLTSSDFVCTVCIFSKAFEADHKSIGLPVKEAGLVYLLATRHLCNCRVVCCALVLLKHPIKHTVVGLWEKEKKTLGSVWVCVRLQPRCCSHSHLLTDQPLISLMSPLIIKLNSQKTQTNLI